MNIILLNLQKYIKIKLQTIFLLTYIQRTVIIKTKFTIYNHSEFMVTSDNCYVT